MSDQGNTNQEETEMTAEPQERALDTVRDPEPVDHSYVERLLARMPDEHRTLAREHWNTRPLDERAREHTVETAEDRAVFAAMIASERVQEWRSNLPVEYADAHPDNLRPDQHPGKLRAWWVSGDRILYLRSSVVGNGKTYAAYAIANAVCDRVWVAAYTVADLIASQSPSESDPRAWKIATRCDLLILDDLGQEYNTDWVREHLHRLLDTRGRYGRRTIITTNRSGTWIEDGYGSAVADRLKHDAWVLEFTGESRRQPQPVRDWGELP